MSRFTPGPWEAMANGPNLPLARIGVTVADYDGGGFSSYCVALLPKTFNGETTSANARLIAAAPDLLAALQALDADWSAFEPKGPDGTDYLAESTKAIWRQARAAIAKATGEQS